MKNKKFLKILNLVYGIVMIVFGCVLVVASVAFWYIDDYLFYMITGLCSTFTAFFIIILLANSAFKDYKQLKEEEKNKEEK